MGFPPLFPYCIFRQGKMWFIIRSTSFGALGFQNMKDETPKPQPKDKSPNKNKVRILFTLNWI
jgi:hypothetical protein